MTNGNGSNGTVVRLAITILTGGILLWIGWISSGVYKASAQDLRIQYLEEKTTRTENALQQIPQIKEDLVVLKTILQRWDREKRFEPQPTR